MAAMNPYISQSGFADVFVRHMVIEPNNGTNKPVEKGSIDMKLLY